MGDLLNIKNDFTQLFKCGICLDLLVLPKTLSCQHSFCKICLEALVMQTIKLVCPICRNVNFTDEVEKISTNRYIQQSIDIIHGTESSMHGVQSRRSITEVTETFGVKNNSNPHRESEQDYQNYANINNIEENDDENVYDDDDIDDDDDGDDDDDDDDVINKKNIENCTDNDVMLKENQKTDLSSMTKKKSKASKLLKYLNRKLYGEYEEYELSSRNRVENQTHRDSQKRQRTDGNSTNSGAERNACQRENQIMLTMSGVGLGVLSRRPPSTGLNSYKTTPLQGYGYTILSKQTSKGDTRKKKPRKSTNSSENDKNPYFCNPFNIRTYNRTTKKRRAKPPVVILLK